MVEFIIKLLKFFIILVIFKKMYEFFIESKSYNDFF